MYLRSLEDALGSKHSEVQISLFMAEIEHKDPQKGLKIFKYKKNKHIYTFGS